MNKIFRFIKKNLLIILPILLIIYCQVKYQLIGAYVAPDGTLVEPFYLIGISAFTTVFLFAVIIVKALKYLIIKAFNFKKQQRKTV
ncbi:MAG: DUF3955 domain-containing protein [Sarcina sp.]